MAKHTELIEYYLGFIMDENIAADAITDEYESEIDVFLAIRGCLAARRKVVTRIAVIMGDSKYYNHIWERLELGFGTLIKKILNNSKVDFKFNESDIISDLMDNSHNLDSIFKFCDSKSYQNAFIGRLVLDPKYHGSFSTYMLDRMYFDVFLNEVFTLDGYSKAALQVMIVYLKSIPNGCSAFQSTIDKIQQILNIS